MIIGWLNEKITLNKADDSDKEAEQLNRDTNEELTSINPVLKIEKKIREENWEELDLMTQYWVI